MGNLSYEQKLGSRILRRQGNYFWGWCWPYICCMQICLEVTTLMTICTYQRRFLFISFWTKLFIWVMVWILTRIEFFVIIIRDGKRTRTLKNIQNQNTSFGSTQPKSNLNYKKLTITGSEPNPFRQRKQNELEPTGIASFPLKN